MDGHTRRNGPRIEYWRSRNGRVYYHVKHANGRVTGPSQGYVQTGSALRQARKENPGLPVMKLTRR